MYLNQSTGRLYAYTTRTFDHTGGVLCIDTKSSSSDPYCGFTALTGTGEAPPTTSRAITGTSDPMLIAHGTEKFWYSFNFAAGKPAGDKDKLLCFNLTTGKGCPGQPYAVSLPAGNIETVNNQPVVSTAPIGADAMIPINVSGQAYLACFNGAKLASCSGRLAGQNRRQLGLRGAAAIAHVGGIAVRRLRPKLASEPKEDDPCFNLSGSQSGDTRKARKSSAKPRNGTDRL